MKQERRTYKLVALHCDCCGRDATEDQTEALEFLSFKDTAGYASRHLGDGTKWSIDLCQDCVYTLLGNFIQRYLQ